MSQQLLLPPNTRWRTRGDYGHRPSRCRPLGVTEHGRVVWEQQGTGRFIVIRSGTAASFTSEAEAVAFAVQGGEINRSKVCTYAYGSPKRRGEALS
jgi:hypothetical protein